MLKMYLIKLFLDYEDDDEIEYRLTSQEPSSYEDYIEVGIIPLEKGNLSDLFRW